MEKLLTALEEGKTLVFDYCGKKVELSGEISLDDMQEHFGSGLDVLDLFRANWSVKE